MEEREKEEKITGKQNEEKWIEVERDEKGEKRLGKRMKERRGKAEKGRWKTKKSWKKKDIDGSCRYGGCGYMTAVQFFLCQLSVIFFLVSGTHL